VAKGCPVQAAKSASRGKNSQEVNSELFTKPQNGPWKEKLGEVKLRGCGKRGGSSLNG